jgi:hypothetical protein
LILGSNEIGPVNEIEMFICVVLLILSLFLGVFLLSDVAVLIGDFGKADVAYQEKLDSMNSLLANLEIEDDLQVDIREFFFETYNTRESIEELNTFFEMITPSLRLVV